VKFSLTIAVLALALPAWSQDADTILVNGKILTVDNQNSTRAALAIKGGRIVALGGNDEIRKLAGARTRVIDLEGRTVIPGLIDAHMHAIRAGQTFATEVNWVGTTSLAEALGRITEASHTMKPGAWLIVAGGWNVQQFREKRRPTQADLIAAAPDNPTYVQLGYGWAVMNPAGFKALNISSDADLPRPGKLERDASGKPTGAIDGAGGNLAIVALFDRLPQPTLDEQVAGTKKFFRELNRLGITGVGDPGGNNVNPEDYQPIFKVWRQGQLTVRVAYSLCGPTAGKEFEELKSLTQMLPSGFGDDMLRFNGLGERVTWGMNNNDHPSTDDKEKYYEIARWAAQRGMPLTMHWPKDEDVDTLLTIFERVNRETPIANLRWSIAHLGNASPQSLRRMKALGLGWTVQRPAAASIQMAKELGVVAAEGTDAHRVASYNPFTALEWFAGGAANRAEALRMYTLNSSWFSFDEDKRGSLEPGKLADLAVLSKDYMTVPAGEIGGIESLLTMVGGRIVYAAGPYRQLESRP
jgi:predicted amidohydrolase YtcJ